MKRILSVLFWFTALWLVSTLPAQAAENPRPLADPGVLCLPGVYIQAPGDCNPLGPSVTLTQLAEMGFTFPVKPMNYSRPDPSLTYVDYRYGFVKNRNAPVYASVDDALKGINAKPLSAWIQALPISPTRKRFWRMAGAFI